MLNDRQISFLLHDSKIGFLARSQIPTEKPRKQRIIMITGFNRSGQTTVSREMALISGSVHVQFHSAEFILREQEKALIMFVPEVERKIDYDDLPVQVMEEVCRTLLAQGHSVIIDGMTINQFRRSAIPQLAENLNIKIFFVAVVGDLDYLETVTILKKDWTKPEFDKKCWEPGRSGEYADERRIQQAELKRDSQALPNLFTIKNKGTKEELEGWAREAWKTINIERGLTTTGR